MKKPNIIIRLAIAITVMVAGTGLTSAQMPPPPGDQDTFGPPPTTPGMFGAPSPGPETPPPPAPAPPPGWGAPGMLMNPPTADWMNQGTMNVMSTGYDSEGVMKQIPLFISYTFNGVNYNITVLNAWNPYTENWNIGVDIPAYSTSYYINGFTYNYYAVLPIGTFYFNL